MNEFVASLDEAEVRRAVKAVRLMTELCIKMGGSLSDRNTKEGPLRSSNISTAWSYEPLNTFVMFEN